MKTSYLKSAFCLLLMLSFVSGCGKDNSSGGSSKEPNFHQINGYSSPDMKQAYSNLTSWYSSTTEGLPTTAGVRMERRRVDIFDQNNGCKTKTLFGFIDLNYCLSNEMMADTDTIERPVYVVLGQKKSSNANLAKVFNAPSGYSLTNVSQQNGNYGKPVYVVEYANLTNGQVIRYKIDTGLNSAFNPVEIYDSAQRRIEYVINSPEIVQDPYSPYPW